MINENYEKLKQALDLLRDYNYNDSAEWIQRWFNGEAVNDFLVVNV